MESLWIDNPAELFTKETWTKFVPTSSMDVPTAMNAIVRFTVYVSVVAKMESIVVVNSLVQNQYTLTKIFVICI